MKLEIGTTYYHLTYADPGLSMPGIEPLVYIGKEILDDSDPDTHQFQDTISFVRFGRLGEGRKDAEDIYTFTHHEKEIGNSIITLEMVAEEIPKALSRFNSLDKPKLQKATGKWVTINP